MSQYLQSHMARLATEVGRMVNEVPLYRTGAEAPPVAGSTDARVAGWLAARPTMGKKELRRGFPKSLLRQGQDLPTAMHDGKLTLISTSGTTQDRLQVLWEWSWWDPQEREAMRLNARVARALDRPGFHEAVLTTPSCGGGTCHIGSQSRAERTIDGMLFLNQAPDPSYWSDGECERMLREWREFAPRGIEADPAYLAMLCRYAQAHGIALPSPEFVALTYETTTRAHRRDIARAIDAPLYQLYGATEAGVLFMECERGRLHANERHGHIELLPVGDPAARLGRVLVTTLGREWMPLLRYEIGDVVRVAAEVECACGRPAAGPLLERVEGRWSDCVQGAFGQVVTPLMLDDALFAQAPELLQWQLEGDVLSVAGDGAAAAAAAVSALLGRPVRGETVSAIVPEASGKYRLVRG